MWLDDLLDYTAQGGLGTVAVDLWAGPMPPTENDAPEAGIAMEQGRAPTIAGGNTIIENLNIVLGVRASTYAAAWERCTAIRERLRTITNQTIGSTYFIGVVPASGIEDVGRDERNRQQFTARFEVHL